MKEEISIFKKCGALFAGLFIWFLLGLAMLLISLVDFIGHKLGKTEKMKTA
jgi:hypothetical protein